MWVRHFPDGALPEAERRADNGAGGSETRAARRERAAKRRGSSERRLRGSGVRTARARPCVLPALLVGRRARIDRVMSAARPKIPETSKASIAPARSKDLVRGLPGTESERAEQRRRFAQEHRETLRPLGK
jgi:hypothetical protein